MQAMNGQEDSAWLYGQRESIGKIAASTAASAQAHPSTVLVREWNGRRYQVNVLADGFEMDGRHLQVPNPNRQNHNGHGLVRTPLLFGLVKVKERKKR